MIYIIIILLIYCIYLIWFFYNRSYIVNPYNKYKIYYDTVEKFYYAKYLRSYLFPVFVKYRVCVTTGLYESEWETVKFYSLDEAINEMKDAYWYNVYEKKKKSKEKRHKLIYNSKMNFV